MMHLRVIALALIGSMISASAQSAVHCDFINSVEMSTEENTDWQVRIAFESVTIPINIPFKANVMICSEMEKMPSRVVPDATMPAHKHGMNYNPEVVKITNGHYVISNLVFHMPGVWQIEFTAYVDDKPIRFTHDVDVQ